MAAVLEVAILETESRLYRDMGLWLDPAKGNAQMAIAIKANRTRQAVVRSKKRSEHWRKRLSTFKIQLTCFGMSSRQTTKMFEKATA
ncbi:unnamed protein product [Penicillium camemberti]|uniref:Str. FM013 n=1 Tax=Penicillium camemberti (strain FM 013) TaxID=1429867 RepID=A0A0G4PGF4_PENC3|nr:unnamed protein product [Penicillium camemberti]